MATPTLAPTIGSPLPERDAPFAKAARRFIGTKFTAAITSGAAVASVSWTLPKGSEAHNIDVALQASDSNGVMQSDVAYRIEYDNNPVFEGSDEDLSDGEFRALPPFYRERLPIILEGSKALTVFFRNPAATGADRFFLIYVTADLYRAVKSEHKE